MSDLWHVVSTDAPSSALDILTGIMHEMGCNGCIEEKSATEGSKRLVCYFDASKYDKNVILKKISDSIKSIPSISNIQSKISTSAATDWSREWRQWFKPFEIIQNVIVVPSWEKYTEGKNDIIINLDPGMAFGTGLHPTTKLCSKEIKLFMENSDGISMLDVGTGSGILSILARKIGIKNVSAVEIDADARKATIDNFAKNKIDDVEVFYDVNKISRAFDLVVANILLPTLIELKKPLVDAVLSSGKLVMSGITIDQEDELEDAFRDDLTLVDKNRLDEWSCLSFERKGS